MKTLAAGVYYGSQTMNFAHRRSPSSNRILDPGLAKILVCVSIVLITSGTTLGGNDGGSPSERAEAKVAAQAHPNAHDLAEKADELLAQGDLDEAIATYHAALAESEDIALQAEIYHGLAKGYFRLEDLGASLEAVEHSRVLAFATEEPGLKAQSLILFGNVFVVLRDYQTALDYYAEAKPYAEDSGDASLIANVFNNLGIVYWRMEDYVLSERYLRRALRLKQTNDRQYYNIVNNIGVALMEQGRLEEAEDKFELTHAYYQEQADSFSYALNRSNLADLEGRKGNAAHSLELASESLAVGLEIGNVYIQTRTYRHQAKALIALGRPAEAEEAFKRALSAAEALNDPAEEMITWEHLIALYEADGRYEEALHANRTIQQIREEILSQQVRYQAVLLDTQYETARREKEIVLLNQQRDLATYNAEREKLQAAQMDRELQIALQKNATQAWQRNFFLGGLVVTVLILILLFNRFRFQRAAYRQIATQHEEIEKNRHSLEQANESLRALNQEKDEFLGIAAHDLQTPLMAQRGFAELLQNGWQNYSPEEIHQLTSGIAVAADTMHDIIKNLLESHRLEQGGVTLDVQRIDPLPTLERVVRHLEPQAQVKRQKFDIDFQSNLPSVMLDSFYLERIVENLVSNAIKYSPPAATIWISAVSTSDGHFQVTIRDEGVGIPVEEQPRVFEKFARLSPRTTAGETSTGLGLTIVKKLTALQGGTVGLKSAPGKE